MKIENIINEINQKILELNKEGIVKAKTIKDIVNRRFNIYESSYKCPVSYSKINEGYGLRITYNSKFIIINGEKKKTIVKITLNIFSSCKYILDDIKDLTLSQFNKFDSLIHPRGMYYPAPLDKYILQCKEIE